MFPDGLIAPIWVRKHRELIPSTFVCFYCLADPYAEKETFSERSASGPSEEEQGQSTEAATSTQAERAPSRKYLPGQELKARDDELVRLITERKKSLVERGIKFTVVLFTTREILENPHLEPRLSYIRRSSGLDAKASLFVLTPVTSPELSDFVTSLQGALYDQALDYYREHARRVRRKRARYPPPATVVQPILQSVAASRPECNYGDLTPLSREGWHVRAEYKLATFAEFSADYDLALGHCQEAYDLLAGPRGMMSSTALLPPRTKRWAEAKVLSDAVSVRISKLYLYADDCDGALHQFRRHLSRFVELSSGWGIGDATFEFWSWLGKQYRLMAGLLEQATRNFPGSPLPPISVPIHAPQLPGFLLHNEIADHPQRYPSLHAASGALLSPNSAAVASGRAPSGLLQSPASFYYMAALCVMERKARFVRMIALENSGELSEGTTAALIHEKQVDHCSQSIEVFGRAHDLYKEMRQEHCATFVAARIATIYAEHGQHKMALSLLERIIKSYKMDDWPEPLWLLLIQACACAKSGGDHHKELTFLLDSMSLVERLHPSMVDCTISLQSEQTRAQRMLLVAEKWAALCSRIKDQPTVPELDVPSVSYRASAGPLQASIVFKEASVHVGKSVLFQLSICNPCSGTADGITLGFASLDLIDPAHQRLGTLTGDAFDATKHVTSLKEIAVLPQRARMPSGTCLVWKPGQTRVFEGIVEARESNMLSIAQIALRAIEPLSFNLNLDIEASSAVSSGKVAPKWLHLGPKCARWVSLSYRKEPSVALFKPPAHKLEVKVEGRDSSYLDELASLRLSIKNHEEFPLQCTVEAFVKTPFPQDMASWAHADPTPYSSLPLQALGILAPGEVRTTTLAVLARTGSGLRSIRFCVRSWNSSAHDNSIAVVAEGRLMSGETTSDFTWSVHRAFRAEFGAVWRQTEAEMVKERAAKDTDFLGAAGDDPFEPATRSPIGRAFAQGTATATVQAAFGVLIKDNLIIRDVQLVVDKDDLSLARVAQSVTEDGINQEELRQASLEGSWREGDRWSSSWQVEVDVGQIQKYERSRGPRSHLSVTWQRSVTGEEDFTLPLNTTRLALPILAPPHLNPRVLVASPPVAQSLQAFTLVFVVVNPSSHVADVSIFVEDDSAWAVSHRTLSIPSVPPRGSRSIPTRIIPRAQGNFTLPRVRAFQERSSEAFQATGGMLLMNETKYGIPLHVRYRASAGATVGSAAQRAVATGQRPLEQDGPSLSILVLPADGV